MVSRPKGGNKTTGLMQGRGWLWLPALAPGWLVLQGTSSHPKAPCSTSAHPASHTGARPLTGWRRTGPWEQGVAACGGSSWVPRHVELSGRLEQRLKATNPPLPLPHDHFPPSPLSFFFRPCSDCYFVLTAENGIDSRGSQAQLLRKLQCPSCESASPW